jgi:hypothetical protein
MVRLLIRVMLLQEKELAKTAKQPDRPVKRVVYKTVEEVRAELIARGFTRDMLANLETPSNVIDGPFKRKT